MQRYRRPVADVVRRCGSVALAAACGERQQRGTFTVTVEQQRQQQQQGAHGRRQHARVSAGLAVGGRLRHEGRRSTVTYGAIGSGGGIDQITARAVDFGASDAPLTTDQATACKGCVQIPWALGATVVAYNVKGAPNNLKLTGPVLADMFLGNITSWNDPKIKALNPGVNLPSTQVTPIYRSDGSGTASCFTELPVGGQPGVARARSAPRRSRRSRPAPAPSKNSGVVAAMQSTDGAIGYVAISYIAADSLNEALMQNAAGKYPTPSVDSIKAAARRGHDRAAGRDDHARESARLGGGRLSAVLLHVRDRAEVVARRRRR